MNLKNLNFIHLEQCDSTQFELKRKEDAEPGMIISTEFQRQGVGRHEREWLDSKGSIAFSAVLPLIRELSWQSLYLSVLVADYLENKFNKSIFLKWPNDILNSDAEKIGGILVDVQQNKAFVGIGINLFDQDHFPFASLIKTTPDTKFSKKEISFDLAQYLLIHFEVDPTNLKNRWEKRCSHLHKEVSIEMEKEKITGTFMGLGNYGQALVQTINGTKECFTGTLRGISHA